MPDDLSNVTEDRMRIKDQWERYFGRFYQNRRSFSKWVIGCNVTAAIVCFSLIGDSIPYYWGRECTSAFQSIDAIQAGRVFSAIFFILALGAIIGWRWSGLSEFAYLVVKTLSVKIRRGDSTIPVFSSKMERDANQVGLMIVVFSMALFLGLVVLGFTAMKVYNAENLTIFRANVHLTCAKDPLDPIPYPKAVAVQ